MKKLLGLFLALAAVLLLTGCQPTPETEAVTSKNDGTFEAALQDEAETADTALPETYTDSFTSADGVVRCEIQLEGLEAPDTVLPVIRITPHEITSGEAEAAARAVFCDADIYEYSPADPAAAALCDWQFRPESYYDAQLFEGQSIVTSAVPTIMATASMDDMPYVYRVTNRAGSDYQIHSILAYVEDDVVPLAIRYADKDIDADSVLAKANAILKNMGLGEWEIVSCEVSGGMTARARIIACPVYSGVTVTYQPQLENVSGGAGCYYEQTVFEYVDYSGGELLSFELQVPMDVVEVMDADAAVLSFDEIMECLRAQAKNGGLMSMLGDAADGSATLSILMNKLEVGLARVRAEGSDTDYCLVPAYTFRGEYELYDENGETVFASTDVSESRPVAVINALDGSLINVLKGY